MFSSCFRYIFLIIINLKSTVINKPGNFPALPGKYLSFLLILLVCFSASGDILSQNWKFVKEKYGIKVYTAIETSSSLKMFRGVADLKTSVDKVFAIVGNVRSTDNWDKSIKELRVLSSDAGREFSYYLIYSIPWPLQNRDLCVEATISHDSATGDVIIYARSRPQLVPENSDLVRIRNYWQKWIIHPLDKDHIRLILEGFADPGGNIPSWLYNMVITDTPINMIHDIRLRVE
jgi:hypothetical protein